MKRMLLLLLIGVSLVSCAKLPKGGWYKNSTSGERIYVVFAGSEDQINDRYKGRFTKDDFVAAFAKTRSSQFINEGKPKYFAVVSDAAEGIETARIMAVEVLERDFKAE